MVRLLESGYAPNGGEVLARVLAVLDEQKAKAA